MCPHTSIKLPDPKPAEHGFFFRFALLALPLCLLLLLGVTANAQNTATGVKVADYFSPEELPPGAPPRLKALLTGSKAQLLSNDLALLVEPRILRFSPDGQTNLIASSTEAFLDTRNRIVSSPHPLTLVLTNGQMILSGIGYHCQLTNFFLLLSNKVETTLLRSSLASARSSNGKGPSLPGSGRAGIGAATGAVVRVFADRAIFDYQAGMAKYEGRVTVDDPPMKMTSDRLTISVSTNGTVTQIQAERNVVLVNTQDRSRATGDVAVYTAKNGADILVLSGKPARWQDAQVQASGHRLRYDMLQQRIDIDEEARCRLLNVALDTGDWTSLGQTSAPRQRGSTNDPIDISAKSLTFLLPLTNRPSMTNRTGRSVLANTNVVITRASDDTRATARAASFSEVDGRLELSGKATWKRGDRFTRGEKLVFNRTSRAFHAVDGAFLRIPTAELGKEVAQSSRDGAATKTNLPSFLEISSRRYDLENGWLKFTGPVKGRYLEGETPQALLQCGDLRIKVSNQVERLVAEHQIKIDQLPTTNQVGIVLTRQLQAQFLEIEFATNGRPRQSWVRTNVVVTRTLRKRGAATNNVATISAQRVTTDFFTHTNRVRLMVAEEKVRVEQDDILATGERAVYTAMDELVRLTGNPSVTNSMGSIPKADQITWDHRRNRFWADNPLGGGRVPDKLFNSENNSRKKAPAAATNASPAAPEPVKPPATKARQQPRLRGGKP